MQNNIFIYCILDSLWLSGRRVLESLNMSSHENLLAVPTQKNYDSTHVHIY